MVETEDSGPLAGATVRPLHISRLKPPEPRAKEISALIAELRETEPIAGEPLEPLYQPLSDRPRLELRNPGQVIGIAGLPKNGKDVIVDYLEAFYSGIARTAFSDYIIEEVNEYLASLGQKHRISAENKSESVYRRLLQAWGIGRPEEDKDYWTNQIAERISELRADPNNQLIIVTGVRLPADFDTVEQRLGGDIWRANRPGNDYVAEHPVEIACAEREVAYVVENPVEGNLRPFEENIEACLNNYRDR